MHHLGSLDIKALALARRSAAPVAWSVGLVEELTREDIVLLASGAAPKDPKAPLARIAAPHHMLARLVAEGKGDVEVSVITGYTPGRIRTLRADPAFNELTSYYEGEIAKTSPDITARVTHIALAAAEILQDRLETEPESFTKKELRELMTAGLDRIGHGPTARHVVQLNDPSRIIAQLGEALRGEGRSRVIGRDEIEGEFTEILESKPNDEATPSSGPTIDLPGTQEPLGNAPEAEREGGRGVAFSEESRPAS